MKTQMTLKTALVLTTLVLSCLPQLAAAQGTLYASNLGQTPTGSAVIGSDRWIAQNFTTGIDPNGYNLDSIQLLMDGTSGSPSGFSVSIFSSLGNGSPGSSLGNLSGSDPASGGVFIYTASGIMLSPSSSYFVVVTAATPVSQGAYGWSAANSSGSTQWAIDAVYASSANGSSWTLINGKAAFQMAIYATAAPEPSCLCLLGVGGVVSALFFRNRRKS
jgi:hypothetical protein